MRIDILYLKAQGLLKKILVKPEYEHYIWNSLVPWFVDLHLYISFIQNPKEKYKVITHLSCSLCLTVCLCGLLKTCLRVFLWFIKICCYSIHHNDNSHLRCKRDVSGDISVYAVG